MKKLIVSISLFIISTLISAATMSQPVNDLMYQAYIKQKKELWKKSVELATVEFKQKPTDVHAHLKLGVAHYGLLLSTMSTEDKDLFDEYVSATKDRLKEIIELPSTAAEGKGLLSAVLGLQMAYSPMKGMLLGGKSSNLAAEAKELAPTSPLAWRFYGINKFYTPSTFGGDIKEAIVALEKSIALFESTSISKNWLYLDTLALLGQAYTKAGEKSKAIATFEKAIAAEAGFTYAKSLLTKAKNS
ncbi:MAG: tetratricopeptide repeat protein [Cytophagales bacterium]|nr:tetratricopeptide repeat protein [Cytophagales bacterium]MCA6367439.1 tetratricopeptide repeat protein [Cytophagales bacterium]MCA6372580.1 tetratricopeptide repeat protein [Cytophagales bacterium]MCA6377263.1 tetratricopeptide repeat protein [Cytophagales bacterium]MCA6383896.1 tetratricopeptide repeat protein [Cytophagales bacterium]